MVEFMGKPLLQWQIEAVARVGIDRVVVIGGHHDETLPTEGVVRYRNARYAETNMVETLMCARAELAGPVIIAYGDVVFEDRVLKAAMDAPVDIGVTVDLDWRPYWIERFGNAETDVETLEMSDFRITRIGQPNPGPEELHARYVGLLKFTSRGVESLTATYDAARATKLGQPWQTSKTFERGYMTDLLQELVDTGAHVHAIPVRRGWLEFDTADDVALATRWAATGRLAEFCALGAR
jgi:choline kinase